MKLLLSKSRSRTLSGSVSITKTVITMREAFVNDAKITSECYASFGLDEDDRISLFIVRGLRPNFLKVTSSGRSLSIHISKTNRDMMTHYFGVYDCRFKGVNSEGVEVYNLHRLNKGKSEPLID